MKNTKNIYISIHIRRFFRYLHKQSVCQVRRPIPITIIQPFYTPTIIINTNKSYFQRPRSAGSQDALPLPGVPGVPSALGTLGTLDASGTAGPDASGSQRQGAEESLETEKLGEESGFPVKISGESLVYNFCNVLSMYLPVNLS